jgi:hypothetical protein
MGRIEWNPTDKAISAVENDCSPLGAVNRLIADAAAWVQAAARRYRRANALLVEQVNPERVKAGLPAIPLIPLPTPVDFIEPDAPGVSDAGPGVPPREE